jgi:hypothetical protein
MVRKMLMRTVAVRAIGRFRIGILGVAVAVAGGWLTAGPAFAAGDANEATCPALTESSPGFRAWLPDCRAYEIVSEANSGDAANVTGSYGFPDGAHVYYKSFLPTPGAGARNGLPERFLATRTSSGWVQSAISPPQGEAPANLTLAAQENAEGVAFANDFTEAVINSPFQDPFEEPRLNETLGMGVYRLSLVGADVSLVSLPDSGGLTQSMIEEPAADAEFAAIYDWGAFLAGANTDASRVFFVTSAKFATAPGTPHDTHEAGNEIYERTGGHTYLVGVLPDGSVPSCGAEVGQGVPSTLGNGAYSYGAIAPSGANVVFGGGNCNSASGLFLRDVVHGTTVPLQGSLFGGRAGTGSGEEEKILTLGGGIHEYHVGTAETTDIGSGNLLTYSSDGSRVYFLGGEEGIYVYEKGGARLISGTQAGGYRAGGRLAGGLINYNESTPYGTTRNMPVASGGSSDGSHLLFVDSAQLTSYENKGHFEAYVYDAETRRVTCISCNPLNRNPLTLELEPEPQGSAQLIYNFAMDIGEQQYQTPSPPFISEDGSRAVFETTEALVPQDTNGTTDVYEWEQANTNGCTESSGSYSKVIKGCVYLLSSGLGVEVPNENGITDGAHLVGASENLKDVYVQTSESLLPGIDNASHLYDVRIDGGFPYTPATSGCEQGECTTARGESAAPDESTTEAITVPGNVKSVRARSAKRLARLSRARKLARALRACRRRKGRRRRATCEHAVRRQLGKEGGGGHADGRGR